MKLLEGTATDLPWWVRGILGLFAMAFLALAWWLATDAREGPVSLVASVLSVGMALLLLISAARGRIWRWMWFFSG